jgi:hypothetical protein
MTRLRRQPSFPQARAASYSELRLRLLAGVSPLADARLVRRKCGRRDPLDRAWRQDTCSRSRPQQLAQGERPARKTIRGFGARRGPLWVQKPRMAPVQMVSHQSERALLGRHSPGEQPPVGRQVHPARSPGEWFGEIGTAAQPHLEPAARLRPRLTHEVSHRHRPTTMIKLLNLTHATGDPARGTR